MAGKYLGTMVHKETEKLLLSKYKTFIIKTSHLGYTAITFGTIKSGY